MAAPVVETGQSNNNSSDDATVTINMPTVRPIDDLYVALMGGDDNDYTWSGNGSFNLLVKHDEDDDSGGFNGFGSATFYSATKIGGASEPANYDFTRSDAGSENMAVAMLRISGVDTTTPIGAISARTVGSSATANAAAITATHDDSIILTIVAVDTDEVTSFDRSTLIYASVNGSSSWCNIGVGWEASPGDGISTGAEDITLDAADDWVAWKVEIMPIAGGAETVSPADLNHAHGIDVAALIQHHLTTAADLDHAHGLDAAALTQHHQIPAADLDHDHTIDATSVSSAEDVVPVDLDHAHGLDAAALTQHHQIPAADLDHDHTIDATSVSTGEDVVPVDLNHAHSIDASILTQHHQLTAADLDHAQTIDASTLIQHSQITAADLIHLHTIAAASVTPGTPVSVVITIDGVLTIVRGIEGLAEIQQIIAAETKLS